MKALYSLGFIEPAASYAPVFGMLLGTFHGLSIARQTGLSFRQERAKLPMVLRQYIGDLELAPCSNNQSLNKLVVGLRVSGLKQAQQDFRPNPTTEAGNLGLLHL